MVATCMNGPMRDVAPLPDLLHGRPLAGPVRERRPVYVDLLPPCNAGCPAGENIQAWLSHTRAGRHEQAWRELVADNPLPAIHDSAVSIHSVERFLGDLALEQGGNSTLLRSAAASVFSWSAPGRAVCQPPTT